MSSIKKSVSKLFLATIGMFLFGFALVPIYDVFCEITGLNGKVTGPTFSEYEDIGNRVQSCAVCGDCVDQIISERYTFITSRGNPCRHLMLFRV